LEALARPRLLNSLTALAVVAVVAAVDVSLRVRPADGLLFVLAFPVALLALQHGERVALAALVGAAAVVFGTNELTDQDLSPLGYSTRLGVFTLAAVVALRHRRRSRKLRAGPGGSQLTARELDVLRLLASGQTNKEAARALGISVRTVESHRSHMQHKLECWGRADLFRRAQELGLLAS
jgi:DNA-binding CsgD family transcriptional regulator